MFRLQTRQKKRVVAHWYPVPGSYWYPTSADCRATYSSVNADTGRQQNIPDNSVPHLDDLHVDKLKIISLVEARHGARRRQESGLDIPHRQSHPAGPSAIANSNFRDCNSGNYNDNLVME